MAFHNRLKQARENAGFTQAEVASFLGVAKSTYSGYETGRSEPAMNNIALLMSFLKISPDYLWQDELASCSDCVALGYANSAEKLFAKSSEDITLSENEKKIISRYRSMNTEGQNALLAYSEDISSLEKYQKREPIAKAT